MAESPQTRLESESDACSVEGARKKFVRLITSFADGMTECYPECPQIAATASKVHLICGASFAVDKLIEEWYRYLCTPIPQAKYACAVERLLGRLDGEEHSRCTMYHAFVYGDVEVALQGDNPIDHYINLKAKLEDPSFDQESRDAALKYIRALNDCVFGVKGFAVPHCPSRTELAEEIKAFREEKRGGQIESQGRLSEAVGTALISLAAESEPEGGDAETIEAIRSKNCARDWMEEWHAGMSRPLSDGSAKTVYDACIDGDYAALLATSSDGGDLIDVLCVCALVNHADEEKRVRCQQIVSHLNVLTKVHTAVPGQVRTRIEDVAQKLACQIMKGELDMQSIDLNQIGRDVMEGCNSEDLSSLAEQIGSLLPILSKSVPMEDIMQNADPKMIEMVAAAAAATN